MDNPLVQPDPGLFLWTILTFLVLLGLLGKFAWKPLMEVLDSREERIRKALDGAAKASEEFERLQEESKQITAKARTEAQSIIATSQKQAETVREEILLDARSRAESIIETAEKQIQVERQKIIGQIRNELVDISVTLASKLIRKNISREDDQNLIEESLTQIQSSRF